MSALLDLQAGEVLTFPFFTPTDAANWSFAIDLETPEDITTDQTIIGLTKSSASRVTKLYIKKGSLGILHSSNWTEEGMVQFKVAPSTRYQIRGVYQGTTIKLVVFKQIVAVAENRDLAARQGDYHIGVLGGADIRGVMPHQGIKVYSFEIFDDAESTISVRKYDPSASLNQPDLIDTTSGENATPVGFDLAEGRIVQFYDWGDVQVHNYGLTMPKNNYAEFEKPPFGAWAFRIKVFLPSVDGQVRLIANKGESADVRFYVRMNANGAINAHIESPTGSNTISTSLKMVAGYNDVIVYLDFKSEGRMMFNVNGDLESAVMTNADFESVYDQLGANFALNAVMFTGGFAGGDNIIAKFTELAIFEWDGIGDSLGPCWDVFNLNQPNYFKNTLLSEIGRRPMTSSWSIESRNLGGLYENEGKVEGFKFYKNAFANTGIDSIMTDYEITWVGIPDYFDDNDNVESRQILWHKENDGQIYLSRENMFKFFVKVNGEWKNIIIERPPKNVEIEIRVVVKPTVSRIFFDDVLVGEVNYETINATENFPLRINRHSGLYRDAQCGIWKGKSLSIKCYNNPALDREYDFSKIENTSLPDVLNGQNGTMVYSTDEYGFVRVQEREVFTEADYPLLNDFISSQVTNPNPVTYKNGKGVESLKDFKAFIDWVNLPDDFATLVTTGQEFIVATDPLGVNRLPVDFRHYDPEQALFKAWTRMHEYGNGKIWILYGKEGFTQPTFEEPFGERAVWDDEESVFHLSEPQNNEQYNFKNSANENHMTGYFFQDKDPKPLSPVGYGASFGSDRWTSGRIESFADAECFAFSAWVNVYNDTKDGRIMSVIEHSDRYAKGQDIALWSDIGNSKFGYAGACRYVNSSSDDLRLGEYSNDILLGQWQYLYFLIYRGGIEIWVDGEKQGEKLTTKDFDFDRWDRLQLGRLWSQGNGGQFPGYMATARLTRSSRNDKMPFEYANQKNPATFWKTGEPEDATGTDFARRVQLTGKPVVTDLSTVGGENETLIIEELDAGSETLNLLGSQSKIFRKSKLGGVDARNADGEILIDESEVGDVKG